MSESKIHNSYYKNTQKGLANMQMKFQKNYSMLMV